MGIQLVAASTPTTVALARTVRTTPLPVLVPEPVARTTRRQAGTTLASSRRARLAELLLPLAALAAARSLLAHRMCAAATMVRPTLTSRAWLSVSRRAATTATLAAPCRATLARVGASVTTKPAARARLLRKETTTLHAWDVSPRI